MGKTNLNAAQMAITGMAGGLPVVTAFANRNSARYAKDEVATLGKIYYMPGVYRDTDYENVAFANYKGELDINTPLAQFVKTMEGGVLTIKHKFYDNWGDRLRTYRADLKRHHGDARAAMANIVNSQTVDATKSLNILDKLLGLQARDYLLQNICTIIPSPNLVLTVDSYTEGSATAKVPELSPAPLQSHTESRTTKILYKNVAHIAISEEAGFEQTHNTMALRQDWSLRDLRRILNSQIATEVETATAVAGADWGAKSGTPPDSTNDAQDDIEPVATTIEGNGFNIDFIAAHNRPAKDLLTNKFIGRQKGDANALVNGIGGQKVISVPGVLPAPVVIDQSLTATIAMVGSKDAMWLGQGPMVVAAYNADLAGYRGWMVKEWWLPYLAQTGGVRKLTGISA